MPRSEIRLLPVFAVLVLVISCAVAAPFAEASGLVSYQGKLTDASGQAVSDGLYNLSFLVYPAATGGTPLWSETGRKVQVTGGLFTVLLGEENPLPAGGFPEDAWLETRVAGTPLTPRARLSSVPWALRARSADSVSPAAAVTSVNSLKGDVTLAAGDNISLSQSGNTITLSGLSIPNPLPVSQSGAWNVGVTGTPTVRTFTQSDFIRLWPSVAAIPDDGSLYSPVFNCEGYRELRLTLVAYGVYSQMDKILVRIQMFAANSQWITVGTTDLARLTAASLMNGLVTPNPLVGFLQIPVMAPQMRIEIKNTLGFEVRMLSSSSAYLVN